MLVGRAFKSNGVNGTLPFLPLFNLTIYYAGLERIPGKE